MKWLNIDRRGLLYDISNYAYIEGHKLESTGVGSEQAHLLTDICAEGNIDRVNRVLDLAWTTLADIVDGSGLRHATWPHKRLRHLAHEYLVCRVLADWLEIVHAPAAKVWQAKADKVFADIRAVMLSAEGCRRRPTGPW